MALLTGLLGAAKLVGGAVKNRITSGKGIIGNVFKGKVKPDGFLAKAMPNVFGAGSSASKGAIQKSVEEMGGNVTGSANTLDQSQGGGKLSNWWANQTKVTKGLIIGGLVLTVVGIPVAIMISKKRKKGGRSRRR